jgi:NAD+ kinase
VAGPAAPARRRGGGPLSRGFIGFLLHPREDAGETLAAALEVAREAGFETWVAVRDPEDALAEHASDSRLLVTVGGDGTFLLGARLACTHGIPVLGVNRGQLGFLTDIELGQLAGAIADFAAGRYREQRRSLLELAIAGDRAVGQEPLSALALNEVVVKTVGTNLARLRVTADDELLGEYDADGVIVATATGSTAYALSAGGPPVDPRLRAVVVVPLAPHAVLTRPVVLPEAVCLAVTLVRGRAFAAADGRVEVPLREGTELDITPGPDLTVVRVPGSTTFLWRLRDKMRMGFPLKQPTLSDGTEAD